MTEWFFGLCGFVAGAGLGTLLAIRPDRRERGPGLDYAWIRTRCRSAARRLYGAVTSAIGAERPGLRDALLQALEEEFGVKR